MKLDYLQKKIELPDLGNVKGELSCRKITPLGHSKTLQGLILKEYLMQEKENDFLRDWAKAKDMIKAEMEKGNIAPLSGIGFSILSDGILNVCRWDLKYIDVIVPQIYTLENGVWAPQKVEKVGAFCSGEKRVYDHENNVWLKYLNSKRTDEDKIKYLEDFLVE